MLIMKDLIEAISLERLNTYRISPADTNDELIKRYTGNLILSESLYVAISVLEVALRNRINAAIESEIKKDWLMQELEFPSILFKNDFDQLEKAKNTIQTPLKRKDGTKIIPSLTNGKLIAELTLGFWVHLFNNAYNYKIWMRYNKVFKKVFPHYGRVFWSGKPENTNKRVSLIYAKLRKVLRLRNRIYHNEPIFNHPDGLDNIYSDIEKLAMAMSPEIYDYINKNCRYTNLKSKISI